MINEAENKATLNKMSDLEYVKNDTEMMRYRVNGLSYKLGIAAMGCGLVAAIISLNSYNPKDVQVFLIIMMNIVLLLGGFLAAEKVKSYSKSGAICQIIFGGISLINIFYVPLIILINYQKYAAAYSLPGGESDPKFDETIGNAKEVLAATITAEKSGGVAVAFLPSSGYLRAGLIIAFLAFATALYICAGIIGYLRAKKLSNYLDSLKETK